MQTKSESEEDKNFLQGPETTGCYCHVYVLYTAIVSDQGRLLQGKV